MSEREQAVLELPPAWQSASQLATLPRSFQNSAVGIGSLGQFELLALLELLGVGKLICWNVEEVELLESGFVEC